MSETSDGDVHVLRVPAPSIAYSEVADWILRSAAAAAAVQQLNERMGLDLVDFPEWGCEGYVHLLNQTEWNRIPSVVQIHGPLAMFAQVMDWPEPDNEL